MNTVIPAGNRPLERAANIEHPQGPFGIAFVLCSTGIPLVESLVVLRRPLRLRRRRMFLPLAVPSGADVWYVNQSRVSASYNSVAAI